MKSKKVILMMAIIFSAFMMVFAPSVVSAKTSVKAPKITLTKEEKSNSNISIGTIDVAYVKNASIYEVYRSTNKKKWNKIGILHVEGTYLDKTGVPNTTYYYRVRACIVDKTCGKYSNVVSKMTTLSDISKVTLDNVGNSLSFYWSSDVYATGYQIKKSTDNKNWGKKIKTEYNSYNDEDVKINTKYYYQVRSYKTVGDKTYYSKWFKFSFKNKIPKISNLTAVASDNGIKLSWTNDGGEFPVEVYRSTSKDGKYERIALPYGNEYYDTKIKAKKNYYYKIRYIYYYNNKTKYGKYATISAKTVSLAKAKKSAVKKAKELVSGDFGYSKKSLISELQYYGYSKKAATYGAENAGINYKKEALKYAKNNITSEKFVKQYLESSGFTKKEINYAMKNANIDYNANARVYDRYDLENYGISKNNLTNNLNNALFTSKQVKNATKNIRYDLQALLRAQGIMSYSLNSEKSLKKELINSYNFTESEAKYAIKKGKFNYIDLATKYAKDNWKKSDYNNYGKQYFIDQLIYYQFSKKDATKIIETANMNYKKKAKNLVKSLIRGDSTYSEKSLKDGLINYYKFTKAEVDYAMKNVKIDANKNALNFAKRSLKDAKEYNYTTSRYSVKSSLKYNGFTTENINYAMKKVSADLWKQAAVDMAKNIYNNEPSYGRTKLIEKLKGEYYEFTQDEAEYGVDNMGVDLKEKLVGFMINDLNNENYSFYIDETLSTPIATQLTNYFVLEYTSHYYYTEAEVKQAMNDSTFASKFNEVLNSYNA
ncbi:MAG: Ltp family lipoprotein [Bacilli bacterium]|nr:Ltp family lipoprotein [Bacilli bacterium]